MMLWNSTSPQSQWLTRTLIFLACKLVAVEAVNMGWKRISRHRAFQKGVSLLRTKSSDNVSTASAVGQTSDRPGRVNGSHGLVANCYALKTENSCWKVGIRRLVRASLVAQMVKNLPAMWET